MLPATVLRASSGCGSPHVYGRLRLLFALDIIILIVQIFKKSSLVIDLPGKMLD